MSVCVYDGFFHASDMSREDMDFWRGRRIRHPAPFHQRPDPVEMARGGKTYTYEQLDIMFGPIVHFAKALPPMIRAERCDACGRKMRELDMGLLACDDCGMTFSSNPDRECPEVRAATQI